MNRKYRLPVLIGVTVLLMAGTLLPWAATPAQALSEYDPTVLISSFHSSGCFQAASATGVTVVKQPCSYTTYSSSANQGFTLRSRGSNRFSIVSNLGTCLGIAGGSTADGARLVTTTCGNAASQLFYMAGGNPYVNIYAAHSGKCLYINASGQVAQGSSCGTSAALGITPVGSGMRIKSYWNNKCLDVDNAVAGGTQDGAKVQQWDCLGYNQTNQRFHLELMRLPDPKAESPFGGTHYVGAEYHLRPMHSYGFDQLIDPYAPHVTEFSNGMPVKQSKWYGTWDEYWQLFPRWRDGAGLTFVIKNSWRPSFCLDLDTSAGSANGGKIQIWQCNGWSNQEWIIRRLTP